MDYMKFQNRIDAFVRMVNNEGHHMQSYYGDIALVALRIQALDQRFPKVPLCIVLRDHGTEFIADHVRAEATLNVFGDNSSVCDWYLIIPNDDGTYRYCKSEAAACINVLHAACNGMGFKEYNALWLM